MTTAFMTLAGPITEPDAICDQLLMAVFASDYSQSNAFLGHISSFQHLVHIHGQNWVNLKGAMTAMFTTVLGAYFSVADVNVVIKQMPDDPAKMTIQLSARLITDTGVRYDFSSLVVAADGIAVEILSGERQVWKS